MSVIDFNKALYRKLESGAQYEKLIPAYQKVQHNFDKPADDSDVYDTLEYMAQWSKKYASQMSKVAPLLAGKNTQETVNNIYNFLYKHFQYKIDNETQYLYSPSAAWFYRRTGFDCKTYSILASTILQCLKIGHSFTMVKQKGVINPQTNQWLIDPSKWSHVYVTVPYNKSYLVIDATTHTNKEVQFVQKHNYAMNHVGLASPSPYGLGCQCQDNASGITGSRLAAPTTSQNLADAVKNFHKFLDELENRGVSRNVTNRMFELVKFSIKNNINPNLKDIFQIASQTPSQLNGGISLEGVDVGGLVTGNPGALLGVVSSILPMDFINSTFLAVFQNGFNFSCWGSTYNPAQTKVFAQNDLPPIYQATLGKGINEQNLHDFYDVMTHVWTKVWKNGEGMGSCSRDAMNAYADAFRDTRTKILEELGKRVKLTKIGTDNIQGRSFGQYTFSMPDAYEPAISWEVDRFKIEPLPATVTPNANGTYTVTQADGSSQVLTQAQYDAAIGASTGTSGSSSGSGSNNNQNGANNKESSSLIPLLIGGGLLAAKFLF